MLSDLGQRIGHGCDPDLSGLPLKYQPLHETWDSMMKKVDDTGGLNEKPKCCCDSNRLDQEKKELDEAKTAMLATAFSLDTFVPLSEVKHAAPPDWVSRVHCTLSPSGRRSPPPQPSSVRLRHSDTEASVSSRPRPRSTNLSPYRGMEATYRPIARGVRSSPRSGSLSPNSVSPTRWIIIINIQYN